MHENTLLNLFNKTIDRLDKKVHISEEEIPKFKKESTDLKQSVQWQCDNVDEVNKKPEDIDRRVEESKLDKTTEDVVSSIKKKLADSEDQSSRNNICLDAIQELTCKTWEKSESIVKNFAKKNE